MSDTSPSALTGFLHRRDPLYHGKAIELRESIKGWLAYIPQTFPHYTRHTVEHSDEIILQISKFLFDDNNEPVIDVSPVEAYILVAAAYLHDAGMVASDTEKRRILESDEWIRWTTEGGGARRWAETHRFRFGDQPHDDAVRNFLADVQARFLIAEFVRRTHHLRAGDVIRQHQSALGRFALDDPPLARTIADVCVAHGLRHFELDNSERFPDRRDVRGQPVNVRFLAIVLRLGDLLDMSNDRACPVLLNAACPIPPDSLAHWTQYGRLVHRMTAPDRVEITAECESQDEHRVLQDWCQWIVEEVRNGNHLMSRARRHRAWKLPFAEIEGASASIAIRPKPGASYLPSRWILELDTDAIFDRLIHDVYDTPDVFVRELIQNALDATRCQMYLDLASAGRVRPEFANQADEDTRERYPVRLSLESRVVKNELSGEDEDKQVIVVEDVGIGMDREIIERYFLQVGRSFYTTDEFRRRFTFTPTSRFGIGFLSVFAVSDKVSVETYKPTSPANDGPLRLTLHGPRTYLLTDRGTRTTTGTRIEVWLRNKFTPGRLRSLVAQWCRKVEFPVVVQELSAASTIQRAETADDFIYDRQLPEPDNARLLVKAFAIEEAGIFGDLYVLSYTDNEGESWTKARRILGMADQDPRFPRVPTVQLLHCFHGITLAGSQETTGSQTTAERLDFRADRFRPVMSRTGVRLRPDDLSDETVLPEIRTRWEQILREHLASTPLAAGEKAWSYKQELADIFGFEQFWAADEAMVPIHDYSGARVAAIGSVTVANVITVLIERDRFGMGRYRARKRQDIVPYRSEEGVMLLDDDVERLSSLHLKAVFSKRFIRRIDFVDERWAVIQWARGEPEYRVAVGRNELDLVVWPEAKTIATSVHRTSGFPGHVVGNVTHPFIQWVSRVVEAATKDRGPITSANVHNLVGQIISAALFSSSVAGLSHFVKRWMEIPNLDRELLPPDATLSADMFNHRIVDG